LAVQPTDFFSSHSPKILIGALGKFASDCDKIKLHRNKYSARVEGMKVPNQDEIEIATTIDFKFQVYKVVEEGEVTKHCVSLRKIKGNKLEFLLLRRAFL
jgi:hypothetical protein